jgi:hypothetical protein
VEVQKGGIKAKTRVQDVARLIEAEQSRGRSKLEPETKYRKANSKNACSRHQP